MDRPKQKKVEVSTISGSSTTIEDERIREIGEQLVRYLGPEYISYRKGDGNSQYAYLEGHEAISIANAIFGWDGWKSEPKNFVALLCCVVLCCVAALLRPIVLKQTARYLLYIS